MNTFVLNCDEEMIAVRDLVALLAYPHPPDQKEDYPVWVLFNGPRYLSYF